MRYNNRENKSMVLISGDQPKFDGNTFSVRTDPGAQASKLPEPIPLLGRECPYVDVRYEGNMNLADNTVPVAAMDQDGSEWRKIDLMTMKLRYHYLGLGLSPADHNNAYNRQFRVTQEQAISSAYASQMTELEYMAMKIQSDIPEMDGIIDNNAASDNDDAYFTGSGQFAFLVWYQSFLQNMALIMAKYNTLMSFVDYMLEMGYNAESALTLRFMNLMKKQNVWTVFDQLGNILTSQFFDLDFYQEITAINAVPCRKYHEVGSPLISMLGSMKMPQVCVYPSDAPQAMFVEWREGQIFDPQAPKDGDKDPGTQQFTTNDYDRWAARAKAAIEATGWRTPVVFTVNPPTGYKTWAEWYTAAGGVDAPQKAALLDVQRERYMYQPVDGRGEPTGDKISLNDLVEQICEMLSPYWVIKWARTRYFSGDTVALAPAKAAIDQLIYMVGGMVDITSHFRTDTVDLITFLKVMQTSTTMNHWVLNTPYLHPASERRQVRPCYFKLIYDILTSFGTSGELTLDDNTQGWDIFTWWHASEGIPKYDAFDGGFTMAAAIRGIPANGSNDYSTPPYMIPKLFEIVPNTIKTLNRRGAERALSSESLTEEDIVTDPVLAGARLMDIPASIAIPVLSFEGEEDVDNRDYSQAIRCVNSMFGVGKIVLADSSEYLFMDPKMEGFIGRTYSNANSMALTYINGRAPFRTTSSNGGLGFSFR